MIDPVVGYIVEIRDGIGNWNWLTNKPLATKALAEERREEFVRACGDDLNPAEHVRVKPLMAMSIRWNGQASRVDRIKLEDGVLRIETEDGVALIQGSDERGHGVLEVMTLLFSEVDLQ